jgi:hypothetical protein
MMSGADAERTKKCLLRLPARFLMAAFLFSVASESIMHA